MPISGFDPIPSHLFQAKTVETKAHQQFHTFALNQFRAQKATFDHKTISLYDNEFIGYSEHLMIWTTTMKPTTTTTTKKWRNEKR